MTAQFRAGKRLWSADDDALLRALYPNTPTASIALTLGRQIGGVYQRADKLGLKKSATYLASPAACRTNGRQGMGTRFPKGHIPANLGLRRPGWGPGRMKHTQFKPGCRQGVAAKNWCEVGTIRKDAEGYFRIKVREARPDEKFYGFGNVGIWPLLNRHLWTQAHGEIPQGHSVIFVTATGRTASSRILNSSAALISCGVTPFTVCTLNSNRPCS